MVIDIGSEWYADLYIFLCADLDYGPMAQWLYCEASNQNHEVQSSILACGLISQWPWVISESSFLNAILFQLNIARNAACFDLSLQIHPALSVQTNHPGFSCKYLSFCIDFSGSPDCFYKYRMYLFHRLYKTLQVCKDLHRQILPGKYSKPLQAWLRFTELYRSLGFCWCRNWQDP